MPRLDIIGNEWIKLVAWTTSLQRVLRNHERMDQIESEMEEEDEIVNLEARSMG